MWQSYFLTGFRALFTNRIYAFINIAGLAVGIAAAALIFLYVRYESSYDAWLADSDRMYRLETKMLMMGSEPVTNGVGPRAAIAALPREFPQIEDVVGISLSRSVVTIDGEPRFAEIVRVDPNFFDFFKLPFVRGNKQTALRDPTGVVLTQKEATAYFGDANPIGRTIDIERKQEKSTLRVTGVIEDLPADSHLEFGLIARFNAAEADPAFVNNWGVMDTRVYAKLRPGADVGEINRRLPAFEKRNLGPMDEVFDYRLASVRGIHLAPPLMGEMRPGGDPVAVKAFSAIAALILLIACFNFTNLATAKASQRAREVGLRKVLGASRGQLIAQFMAESILLVAVATMIALALVEVVLPYFNRLLDLQMDVAYSGSGGLLLPALLLTLLVGAVSGFYPAIYLSHFQPAKVLRANAAPGASGSDRLRSALVIGQFAIAIGLIICAAIVHAQTSHARHADPGFRQQGLLALENVGLPQVQPAQQTLLREISSLSGVKAAALASNSPTASISMSSQVRRQGSSSEREPMDMASVDYGFMQTMGIAVIAGRDLAPRFGSDDASGKAMGGRPAIHSHAAGEAPPEPKHYNVLLNRAAVRQLGYENAEAAVGEQLSVGSDRSTIVGVVGDVHYRSLRDPAKATVYFRDDQRFNNIMIRFAAGDPAALRDAVASVWKKVAAGAPFDAEFVEDVLAEHYDADEVRARIFAIAALLAIVIACLGIFGLAAFTVERRKLEIAVRKVFGARDADIAKLMVWQFSRPVLLANLIAWPVAWWLMRDWLNAFSDRITLHPAWFLAAGALALIIAVCTVGGHALRVSRAHPIHALRYE
jgi:putative ABC transport system permease protein